MKWPVLPVSVMGAIALVTSTAACAGDMWRSLGPDGGGVSSVVLDPQNSDTVYALTSGGLFKSTDAGASWTVTTPLPPDSGRVISLVIDPQQTNILYAATAEAAGFVPGRDAVFKSTDGGVTWRSVDIH